MNNKVNDLTEKLLSAQKELDTLNKDIERLQNTRTADLVEYEMLTATLAYMESKKATLERIALNRAFALAFLLRFDVLDEVSA